MVTLRCLPPVQPIDKVYVRSHSRIDRSWEFGSVAGLNNCLPVGLWAGCTA